MLKHFDIGDSEEPEYCKDCGFEVTECVCDPIEKDEF